MRVTDIKLKNSEELKLGDFNVFIGGNGVGKTTILVELFHKIGELQRKKYHWIDSITYSSVDTQKDMELLKSSLGRKYEGLSLFYYSNAVKNVEGNVDNSDNIRFSGEEYKEMSGLNDPVVFNNVKYRRPFVSFSSCESRLDLKDDVSLTSLDMPPQDALNVLYRNRQLLQDIDKNIFGVFKYHFILLSHSVTRLQIGISKESAPVFDNNALILQDEYEKIENWKADRFIPITEAGHGIRSMIKLLMSLLEPVNQIILIDEPEMHLYPSQKRWLGKQLVSLAGKQNKQVFVVTHDPMVLQGILDANTTTEIFRVDRDESDVGVIKSCELDRITDATAMRNQEQYLQGLFYQRCIAVEGASDRSFYQNMFEQYPEIDDKDLGVVAAGGKGSSKNLAYITSKVGSKIVFIYDLDALLFQTSIIKDVYSMLGGDGDPLKNLEKTINPNTEISSIENEKEKQNKIKKVTGYSDKNGLSEEWKLANEAALDEAINRLEGKGIFLVPKGTLESWAPEVEPKVRFSDLAPDVVRGNTELNRLFNSFAKKVLSYLEIDINV